MESANYKIGDIFIGDPDGLTEARNENFTNYFYTKNKAYLDLSNNAKKYIVIGRKGTGKTILGKYYEEQQKRAGKFCKYIDKEKVLFRQLQAIGNGEIPAKERGVFIKYAILTELADSLIKKDKEVYNGKGFWEKRWIKKKISKLKKLLKDEAFDGYKLETIQTTKTSSITGMIAKKISEVNATKSEEIGNTYIAASYYDNVEKVEEIVMFLLHKFPITLIIDDLDEYDERITAGSEFGKFLSKFIEVSNKMNIEMEKNNCECKIILLLRSDLLKLLHNNSTNLNKYTSNATITLDWIKNTRNVPSEHMLLDMICTKIRASIPSVEKRNNEEICQLFFPETIKGNSFLKHILSYSHGRPRDVVTMLGIMIDAYPDEVRFTEKMFLDSEAEYSRRFCDEIRNEMALYYDGEYVKECFLFLNLINRKNFSLEHAQKVYDKCSKRLPRIDNIENCFELLYKFGAVGNMTTSSTTPKYSFGYREDGHDIFNYCERVTIHFAIRSEVV